jgi:hypothetical protein
MDKNVSPYYDDGVEQFAKDYKEVLFNPGVPLQAREASQIQTLLNEQLKKNLDQIYNDGKIIGGYSFNIDVASSECALSDCIFYWNGRVYGIPATTAPLTVGSPSQKFGFNLTEEIISATATDITISNIDGDATTVTIDTDEAHGFSAGYTVTIAGTTNYNGTFNIASITDVDTFTITSSLHDFAAETTGTATASYDAALNDPAAGTPNYNLPGADRLKQTWDLVNITQADRVISSIFGSGTIVTVNTTIDHNLVVGQRVGISGTVSYDGKFIVLSTPTSTQFTYSDTNTGGEVVGTVSGLPDAIELWEVQNDELVKESTQQVYSEIGDLLAERTFDESGHYLVHGMKINIEDQPEVIDQATKLKLVIDPGRAYVKGYQIDFIFPQAQDILKSQVKEEKIAEPHLYSTGTDDYVLTELYTEQDGITQVTGNVQVTNEAVTKGLINTADPFGNSNVDNGKPIIINSPDFIITSIDGTATTITVATSAAHNFAAGQSVTIAGTSLYNGTFTIDTVGVPDSLTFTIASVSHDFAGETTGTATVTYVGGTDYNISGDTIDWGPPATGPEPLTGTSYYVTYQYVKLFVEGAGNDYTWAIGPDPTLDDAVIHWESGDRPVHNTNFFVSYNYYLARTDLVQLDKDQNVIVKTGSSTHWRETPVPDGDKEYLTLGYIKLYPNMEASGCYSHDYNYKRQTMRDLFNLKNRVRDIEYNQADLALESEAKEGEEPTLLKGILVDTFETWKKADTTFDSGGPEAFKCALNNIDGELSKQIEYEITSINPANDIHPSNLTEAIVDGISNYSALTKTGETLLLSQPFKTNIVNLNPYTFLSHAGALDLNPRVDSWIDEEIINIESTNAEFVELPPQSNLSSGWFGWRTSRTTENNELVNSSINRTQTVEETNIVFARQIPISIKGEGWVQNDRVEVYFDDVKIDALGTGGTSNQTPADPTTPLITEADGTFTADITVPAKTRTGEHIIKVYNLDSDFDASAIFTSTGINRVITNRTLTTNTLESQRVDRVRSSIFGIDPIAQSFVFNESKTLSSIDVFFKAGDAAVDAWMEIGYLVNGYPSQNSVFHRQTISYGDCQFSPNGVLPTNIEFTKPIHISADTRFFITLGSASEGWQTYTSELGSADLATGDIVTQNPYVQGVFFQSSNNNTWNAFQNLDLTCKLYEGTYESTGEIVLENKTGLSISKFKFEADETIPVNSDVKYYYSLDNGGSYTLFKAGNFVTLGGISVPATQIRIKIELNSNGESTPLIDSDSYSLLTLSYNTDVDNYYITRTIFNVPTYDYIRVVYDAEIPAGCTVDAEYSVDSGVNWYSVDGDNGTITLEDGLKRYDKFVDIDDDLGASSTATQFKGRLVLNNNSGISTPVIKNLKWIMKYETV